MNLRLSALVVVVSACTGPTPIEDFDAADDPSPRALRYAAIPDGAPIVREPPEPEPQDRGTEGPRIVVGPYGRTEYGSAACPFEVGLIGFPAVRDDGLRIVSAIEETLSASDGEDATLTVRWHDVDADAVVEEAVVFDGMAFDHLDPRGYLEEEKRCPKVWEAARTNAQRVNRKLAQSSWRSMTPLPVHIESTWSDSLLTHDEIIALPPDRRPVELTYTFGWAAFRIPGVRVVSRHAVDWWGIDDEYCSQEPQLLSAFADRESLAIAVELEHNSGACFCYPPTETHTLRATPDVFAAVDARPLDAASLAR